MSSKSDDKNNKEKGINIERINRILNGEDLTEKVVTFTVMTADTIIAYK